MLISISLNTLSYTPLNYPIRNITLAINTRRLHNFEPQRKNKTAWAESPPSPVGLLLGRCVIKGALNVGEVGGRRESQSATPEDYDYRCRAFSPHSQQRKSLLIQVSQALNCLEDNTMRNRGHTRRRRGCPRIANNKHIPSLEGCI